MASDITPDDKNWTWVTTTPCPECGFDPNGWTPAELGSKLRGIVGRYVEFLTADDVRQRPWPQQWSALEYGAHIADVLAIYDTRLEAMLASDAFGAPAEFLNWDQDATAIEDDYPSKDPADVARNLSARGERLAWRFGTVGPGDLKKRGHRSDGSEFTMASFSAYLAHDLVHHIWDVERGNEALRG